MSAGNYYGQPPTGYPDQNTGPQQYHQSSGYPPTSGYGSYQQPPYHDPNQQPHQQPLAYPGGPPLPPGQQTYQQYQQYPAHQAQPPAQTSQHPGSSSWGTAPPNNYPAQPSQQQSIPTDPITSTKSLNDKFKKKLKLRRDSSSSSSSDSDDDKKKKKKQPKKYSFATPPPNMGGPYPFSFLCPPSNPEIITLQIVHAGNNSPDTYLVGPNQGSSHPTYILTITNDRWKEYSISRTPLPSMNKSDAEWVSKVGWAHSDTECQKFKFPWGKWDVPLTSDFWGSDVDFLGGKSWMKVLKIEDLDMATSGRFVARCFDTTTDGMPTVFSFVMKSYSEGRLEIVARLVRTLEQLDEVVTVAWAAMSYHREV